METKKIDIDVTNLTIDEAVKAKKAAEEAAAEAAKAPEWAEGAEKALKDGEITKETVNTLSARIAEGGYPKAMEFAGCYVQIKDEKDLADFWKTVYSNLPKEKVAKALAEGVSTLSETDVFQALSRCHFLTKTTNKLVKAGIYEDAIGFTVEGDEYIIAGGLAIDLAGTVVADVSDIEKPYGPDAWAEITSRILSAYEDGEEEDY